MNDYLFEVLIGKGEPLLYIPISADNLKKARAIFAEEIKKITTREYWLFGIFRRLN